ncbi:MAG TPA: hypothetical protein VMF06_13135 [Candidatus Limnocylindria bacterium]|nr:hypothetical protein [Candidatus Limnocylindria bacterium]
MTTIIGALGVLLIPSRIHFRERSQRAMCRENLRLLGVAAHIYSGQQYGRLFNQIHANGEWGSFILPNETFSQITNLVGNLAIDCPNLYPFTMPGVVYHHGGRTTFNDGTYIGYNYLGGINTPRMAETFGWNSPVRINDDPAAPLFTDPNNHGWIEGYWAVAPHTATGPQRLGGQSTIRLQALVTSRGLGAQGGNVGLLDGSVHWKSVGQMKEGYWTLRCNFENRGMW